MTIKRSTFAKNASNNTTCSGKSNQYDLNVLFYPVKGKQRKTIGPPSFRRKTSRIFHSTYQPTFKTSSNICRNTRNDLPSYVETESGTISKGIQIQILYNTSPWKKLEFYVPQSLYSRLLRNNID